MALSVLARSLLATNPPRKGRYLCQVFLGIYHQYNQALSKESQQIWLDGLGLPGVIPGLQPPPGLAGDPSYPTKPADFDRLIRISGKIQVENESEWFSKFKAIMQG